MNIVSMATCQLANHPEDPKFIPRDEPQDFTDQPKVRHCCWSMQSELRSRTWEQATSEWGGFAGEKSGNKTNGWMETNPISIKKSKTLLEKNDNLWVFWGNDWWFLCIPVWIKDIAEHVKTSSRPFKMAPKQFAPVIWSQRLLTLQLDRPTWINSSSYPLLLLLLRDPAAVPLMRSLRHAYVRSLTWR